MKGEFKTINDKLIRYQASIKEGSSIRATLGEIRKKNDNRFFWYRKKATIGNAVLFKDWIGEINGNSPQGTEKTLELAKMRILEGWTHE